MPPKRLDELRDRVFRDGAVQDTAQDPGGPRRGAGIALKNVHQRLQLFFGLDYGLEITSAAGAGTQIELSVPAPSGPGGGHHAEGTV